MIIKSKSLKMDLIYLKIFNLPLSINEVEEKFKINRNTFYVSFIGTIGMAHGLEIVLKALKTNKNITFLIIGEGARKIF